MRHPVRSRKSTPTYRRDRRQTARLADRACRDGWRGRGQQEGRQCRSLSAGPRGQISAGSPPAIAASCRSRPGADLAGNVGGTCGSRHVFDRRLRPAEAPGFWDLARDHYGSHAAIRRTVDRRGRPRGDQGPGRGRRPADAAGGEPDPWWRQLASGSETLPRVDRPIAVRRSRQRPQRRADALVIGHSRTQATGRDRTLFFAESRADISRARISSPAVGGRARSHVSRLMEPCRGRLSLVEIDGSVPISDPRHRSLQDAARQRTVSVAELGGYAYRCPLRALARQSERLPRLAISA